MGSRFRGNDDWGVAPTWVRRGRGGTTPGRPSGFPLPRERRLGGRPYAGLSGPGRDPARPPLGSRFRGNDDWGAAPGFPLSRERRLGSRPWVPAFAGTTIGEPAPGFPLSRERRLGSRPWVPAFAGTTIGEPAPGFPLPRERRLGTPPLRGTRDRLRAAPHLWIPAPYRGTGHAFAGMTDGGGHARSTVWAKVAARAQGPACGESCRVSGQTSAALWLPAGTVPLLRILPGWGSLYRQCTTRHH